MSPKNEYINSSEFKGKLKIGNNLAAQFGPKLININELLTKSFKTFEWNQIS